MRAAESSRLVGVRSPSHPSDPIFRTLAACATRATVVCARRLLALLVASVMAAAAGAVSIPKADVAGSKDSPIVSRFAGSVIVGYARVDFGTATLPLGRYSASEPSGFADSEQAEGRVTRIAYAAPAGKSGLEVYRNFEQALRTAGFRERFACAGVDGCGGYDFSTAVLKPVLEGVRGDAAVMIETLQPINGDVRALTARLERPAGNVDVALLVSQSPREPVGVLLQVVEAKAMATGQVSVDAKAMAEGLAQAGHMALYGIRFATDSAALTADSDATLAQMTALLKAQPALKVYIVGHTDNAGTLAHNLTLSQQRAESVVRALETRGIAAARLAAKGLASYAPVASNDDEAGRARNRRVELVKQ
ncbi:MAG: OmpA family protein [Proteobacteria bacterium]|nr:OmpA family protein [Pseudomonadota bacterium]